MTEPSSTHDHFASLRALLTEEPSAEAWEALLQLFAQWPEDDDERQAGLAYASAHLAPWGKQCNANVRYHFFDEHLVAHPCPSLVQHVTVMTSYGFGCNYQELEDFLSDFSGMRTLDLFGGGEDDEDDDMEANYPLMRELQEEVKACCERILERCSALEEVNAIVSAGGSRTSVSSSKTKGGDWSDNY